MEFKTVQANDIPLSLLLEADPSETSIHSYLPNAWCFAALEDQQIIGVCVANTNSSNVCEIYNVAIAPALQAKGIGSQLLKFALEQLKGNEVTRVELGTGTFGYQLTFYQRVGFRVDSILKDHFLDNYPEPIFENGIQHKDMLKLYIEL